MDNQKADTTGKKDKRSRVRSPEELDAYIHVVRPGILLLIGAFTLVVVALIAWGFTGSLPVTVSGKGVFCTDLARMRSRAEAEGSLEQFRERVDIMSEEELSAEGQSNVYFFLNAYQYNRADLMDKNVAVSYPGKLPVAGKVLEVDTVPYTKDMITKEFGTSFVADSCATSDYSWVLTVATDETVDNDIYSIVDVNLELGQVRPISLLFQ